MPEDKKNQSYCERGFKIDRDLNGGEIGVKGEEFDRMFKALHQEFKNRDPENFPFICIKLDRKVKMPARDGYVEDDIIDFFEFSEDPEYYVNSFISQGANPAGYVCVGHYGKKKDEDFLLLVNSCKGCRYLTEVR